MNKEEFFTPIVKFTIVTAGLVIVVAGLMATAEMFNVLFLAVIFAVTLSPFQKWLKGKKVPHILALLITFFLVLVIFIGLIIFVFISLERLIESIPQYAEDLDQLVDSITAFFAGLGIDITDSALLSAFNPQELIGLVAGFLGSLIASLANVILLLLVLFFLLLTQAALTGKLGSIFGSRSLGDQLTTFSLQIREYLLITTGVNFMIGMLDAVLLLILGVPFPFLWGLLAFFMGYIPSVGFWIALIPPFILTLLEFGLGKAMIVLVGYVIINGGTQNFVLPKLYGTGLNLSRW